MLNDVNTLLNVAVSFSEYEDVIYNLLPCAERQTEELCEQGVTDRSQEVEVEAVCEPMPTCAENTYSAVPVTFQSHNRKPLKMENYTCSLFENK
jgi:hypothetical protein